MVCVDYTEQLLHLMFVQYVCIGITGFSTAHLSFHISDKDDKPHHSVETSFEYAGAVLMCVCKECKNNIKIKCINDVIIVVVIHFYHLSHCICLMS